MFQITLSELDERGNTIPFISNCGSTWESEVIFPDDAEGVLQGEGILVTAEIGKTSSVDEIEFYASWELHRKFLLVVVEDENDANKAVHFASQENVSVLMINVKPSIFCPLPLVILNEDQVGISHELNNRVVKAKFEIAQPKPNGSEISPEVGDKFHFVHLYDKIIYKEAKIEAGDLFGKEQSDQMRTLFHSLFHNLDYLSLQSFLVGIKNCLRLFDQDGVKPCIQETGYLTNVLLRNGVSEAYPSALAQLGFPDLNEMQVEVLLSLRPVDMTELIDYIGYEIASEAFLFSTLAYRFKTILPVRVRLDLFRDISFVASTKGRDKVINSLESFVELLNSHENLLLVAPPSMSLKVFLEEASLISEESTLVFPMIPSEICIEHYVSFQKELQQTLLTLRNKASKKLAVIAPDHEKDEQLSQAIDANTNAALVIQKWWHASAASRKLKSSNNIDSCPNFERSNKIKEQITISTREENEAAMLTQSQAVNANTNAALVIQNWWHASAARRKLNNSITIAKMEENEVSSKPNKDATTSNDLLYKHKSNKQEQVHDMKKSYVFALRTLIKRLLIVIFSWLLMILFMSSFVSYFKDKTQK